MSDPLPAKLYRAPTLPLSRLPSFDHLPSTYLQSTSDGSPNQPKRQYIRRSGNDPTYILFASPFFSSYPRHFIRAIQYCNSRDIVAPALSFSTILRQINYADHNLSRLPHCRLSAKLSTSSQR